ncbi:MAG: TolC family outer membrane protein [Pseudomonadota bacterium]
MRSLEPSTSQPQRAAPRAARQWRRAASLMAICAGLAAVPAASLAHTINEALAAAYENSGLLDKNRAVLRAADENVAQAVASLRPSLTYALQSTYSNPGASTGRQEGVTNTLTLAASMTLYDFGRTAMGVDLQKELVLATRQALVGAEQGALLNAAIAFFDVLQAEEFVRLRTSNVRLITEEKRAAEDRFDVGEVTRTDVALAEARLAGARSSLASERGTLVQAETAFEEAVGIPSHALTQPRGLPRLPANADAAKAIARQSHPDIVGVRHQITANEIALQSAKMALRPSLTGQVSSSFDLDEDLERSDTVSVTLGGVISQGGQLNSIIRQAQANLDQSRADLHIATLAVDEAVENAYASLSVARASRIASDEQIRASEVAFEGVREEATLGARTTLDVLDAEQELLDARANRVAAVASEFKAAYAVLQATGRLTAQDLGLPVQLYDPTEYYNLVKSAPAVNMSEQGAALQRVLKSLGKN